MEIYRSKIYLYEYCRDAFRMLSIVYCQDRYRDHFFGHKKNSSLVTSAGNGVLRFEIICLGRYHFITKIHYFRDY